MITAYLYRSCTSCRKTEDVLKTSGVEFEAREYFKQPVTREELTGLMEQTGLSLEDVLSTRSRPYKELGLAEKHLSDDDLIELMLGEPRLLKRPIVVSGSDAVVGHSETKLRELIEGATE